MEARALYFSPPQILDFMSAQLKYHFSARIY